MKFNEDSRVKIPAILHCMRLGFEYISLKNHNSEINENTNIFSTIFLSTIQKINPGITTSEAKQTLDEISLALENEDLGRAFYKKLINKSGVRLIDFENFDQTNKNIKLNYENKIPLYGLDHINLKEESKKIKEIDKKNVKQVTNTVDKTISKNTFVHLHNNSQFSVLQSTSRIADIIKKTAE